MKMKIEIGKRYKLTDGTLVRRVLAVDSNFCGLPVIAELYDGSIRYFTAEGKSLHLSFRDLVEVSELDDFKIDEPVMVRNFTGNPWAKRYFAGVSKDGEPQTWPNGATSFSTSYEAVIVSTWNYCRRPTEEELGK